jgi:glutamate-1-semialdehyde aminotransferase
MEKFLSSKKLITDKAKGNFVFINKKKFFDLSMHSGVLLLGHNHKIFRTTLNDLKKNYSITNFQNQNIRDKILKYIKRYFKSAHDLIFCTTGSETVIKAIRISRAINNKSKIFIVSGSWHGSVDQTLYFSKENLKPIPLSSGLNDDVKKNTIILPYNDIEKSKKILNKNYKEASCILIEPITASLPLEKSKYYLKFLREYSLKKRITLIFDEMVTGIRTEKGSVQNRFNIYPDITLAGKAIGGGLPISLIIINKKIFNKIKKLKKKIFFGGTFSGNNFSLISCLNTLSYVNKNKNLLRGIINKSKVIQDKLNNFSIKNNLDVKIYRFDTFLRIVFSKTSINNRIARDFLEKKNKIRITKFTKYLYAKKILYPKNGIIFFSATLTSNNVDYLVKNLSTALKKCFK